MLYGICHLSIVPVRLEPTDTSELVTQLLFGEHFKILEKRKKWSKVRIYFDGYEGYVDNKQFLDIEESYYHSLSDIKPFYSGELVDFITGDNNDLSTIVLGSTLPFFKNNSFKILENNYQFEGKVCYEQLSKSDIIHKAYLFLYSPYLWGGKTPFGIDCSGFTQMVYKLCGYQLKRDAKEQALQGDVLSFIEESEPGDLAFFDNNEGQIVHVGIIMNDYYIIHAHGKVRIDRLDHTGIYNVDTKKHTHKLRVIKKIV